MSPETTIQLTDEELIELDSFLLSGACGDEALSVDEAHGFLAALTVSPRPMAREEWMAAIWGDPDFADEAERQRMTGLLQRLHDDIVATLSTGGQFEPLVAEMEDEDEVVESYEGWCFGFMLGVDYQQEVWEQLPKDEQALLAPMAQIALLDSEEEEQEEMDDDEYASWIELLPGAVQGLYAFWRSPQGQKLAAAAGH